MLALIQREIAQDPYYRNSFDNDGQKFVAWYLRRVLLRDDPQTRDDITDGPNDKEIDAVIVDDIDERVVIVQGKFITTGSVDGGPLQEVLTAWMRLQKLDSLQKDCNERLKKKIEAIRQALDEDYRVEFELLTTGTLTQAAQNDLKSFTEQLAEFDEFSASLHLIDTEMLTARLAEAENTVLPSLEHIVTLDPNKIVNTAFPNANTVIAMLPLSECLKFPGITDGRLFAKNVRQSLGSNNKVNRELKRTIHGDRVRDFMFYHNGITAICDTMSLSQDRSKLTLKGVSVVNGCQSLSTIYTCSERVRARESDGAHILFRFYEIKDRAFGDRISINTNSQSAVKQRDLRSNDRVMVGLQKAFKTRYPTGIFLTKRGEVAPAGMAPELTIDASTFAKCVMAWHAQRPNISYNENKLFDEYYKTLFRTGYAPENAAALNGWIQAIDKAWTNLNMNNELRAGKSYVRYHVLFAVSSLVSAVNKQPQAVVAPSATTKALEGASDILSMAATCVENAMQNALMQAQTAGKVFSPQNWLKSNSSWQGETLVAGTQAGMLAGFPTGPALIERMKAPAASFSARWSAG
jgi:hypothetical protein